MWLIEFADVFKQKLKNSNLIIAMSCQKQTKVLNQTEKKIKSGLKEKKTYKYIAQNKTLSIGFITQVTSYCLH